jgi:hypothetical protein
VSRYIMYVLFYVMPRCAQQIRARAIRKLFNVPISRIIAFKKYSITKSWKEGRKWMLVHRCDINAEL